MDITPFDRKRGSVDNKEVIPQIKNEESPENRTLARTQFRSQEDIPLNSKQRNNSFEMPKLQNIKKIHKEEIGKNFKDD